MGQAKRKQQRDCPAKAATITPEECGRGRNSAIPCPADCGYNPFALANYREPFLDLEAKIIQQLMRKLAGELTPARLREWSDMMERGDTFGSHAFHAWHVHGEGRLAKWLEQGFSRDWKNDEQVMLGFMATLRPALIEFREALDDKTCMAVDLLRPGTPPFVVIDGGAAANAGRFQVVLGWLHDLPAGQRFSGDSVPVTGIEDMDPAEFFDRLLAHLDAPAEDRQAWILEHMPLLAEALSAITVARQQERVRLSDLRRFALRHDFAGGQAAAVIAALEANPRVLIDEPGKAGEPLSASLIAEAADRARDAEARVVGHLLVHPDHLEFEAIGEKLADECRRFIASLDLPLGPEDAAVHDLAPPPGSEPFDPDLVPPEFLDSVAAVDLATTVHLKEPSGLPTTELAGHYLGFADVPVPALDGRTPRAAAADPALRPKLVNLMKGHVSRCDRERRTKGVDFDLNPLLAELGLDELILPPPPLGFVEDEEDEVRLDPPPEQALLEGELLEERIENVIRDEALWNRIEIRLADILDAFNDLPDKFNPHELELLQSTALSVLGALHPDQVPGYDPDAERMIARYESWITSGSDDEMLAGYLDRIFAESRQPALCESAADLLIFMEEKSGKKLRQKKIDALFTALAAAIWEAAHWPPVLK